MNVDERRLKAEGLSALISVYVRVSPDDALPFHFGSLEIDQEANSPPRRSQLVEALRSVFIGETVHAFQLGHESVLNHNIGEVCPVVQVP